MLSIDKESLECENDLDFEKAKIKRIPIKSIFGLNTKEIVKEYGNLKEDYENLEQISRFREFDSLKTMRNLKFENKKLQQENEKLCKQKEELEQQTKTWAKLSAEYHKRSANLEKELRGFTLREMDLLQEINDLKSNCLPSALMIPRDKYSKASEDIFPPTTFTLENTWTSEAQEWEIVL